MSYHDIVHVVKPTIEALGYQCWGIEFGIYGKRALLRIFIDHPDGISLDNCSEVSQQISGVLDVESTIKRAYILEVSSPGLDRPLFERSHYECYVGEKIKVRCYSAIEGRKNILGFLDSVNGDSIIVRVEDDSLEVPFDSIRRANLVFNQNIKKDKKVKV